MTTICTNSEERGTKERNFIPKVAHDTNHPVGFLAPDVKGGAPTQNQAGAQPFPARPHGKKRKKQVSLGRYSKKKPRFLP